MAGWHSLSGYLHYKPGGTLGRLKSKKKQWYLFEESKCQLLYYKSKEDAKLKTPEGFINIKGSAISLDLDQNNQFVITVEGKDHIFTADNHESMMIWLLGLQAKRDQVSNRPINTGCSNSLDDSQWTKRRRSSDITPASHIRRRKKGEINEPNIVYGRAVSIQMDRDMLRHKTFMRRIGESVDQPHRQNVKPDFSSLSPPSIITLTESKSLDSDTRSNSSSKRRMLRSQKQLSSSGSESDLDTSDVFGETYSSSLPPSSSHLSSYKNFSMPVNTNEQTSSMERTSSLSGQSASSDSALEKSESDLINRLAEMEQELIAVKCELAKSMNREACYKEVLEKRDARIMELDDKIEKLSQKQQNIKNPVSPDKKIAEQCRVLSNQNQFLNKEVQKLARLRQQEQNRFTDQEKQMTQLHAEVDNWKRDYVFLLQSSITVPTGDVSDGIEMNLYGGNRHKVRIQQLLEEARQTNPGLPTCEKLASSEVHVDTYGFKHSHTNESLLLHYICHQLHQHYTMRMESYEEHQLKWKNYLRENRTSMEKNTLQSLGLELPRSPVHFTIPTMHQHVTIFRITKELKALCRGGIPPQHRNEVWKQLVYNHVRDLAEEKGPHYYAYLCSMASDSQCAGQYRKQISLDLLRTMPQNVHFNKQKADGIQKMQEVLLAFCMHNPTIGYCQGMNFIVGMCLLFMEPEDSFWTLIAITEKIFIPNYFDLNLVGAQADQEVLKDLIKEKLPELHAHLDEIEIEISTITLNWFLAVFFDSVPFETLLRIWDCFLLEGPKVLFRFSLAMLRMHQQSILYKKDTISIMRHLKSCAKLTFDVEGLMKIAFEDLKPFPHRNEISSKQTCYMNALKEKVRKREQERRVYAEREQMFRDLELMPSNALVIECATLLANGNLWVCHAEQNSAKLWGVSCDEAVMIDLGIEFDSRVMCIVALNDEVVIIGTLSWNLYAFSILTREEMWRIRLHDAVLGLCCHLEDINSNKVFAALADGTVCVIEDVSEKEPDHNIFYIPIGRSPVTSLVIIEQQLWCACGNSVHILHARTLDNMDSFVISPNLFDHVLTLAHAPYGVWISVKGSSVIELWDQKLLTCKLLYDVRENKYPNLRKEDEGYLNKARITALLPYQNSIWIGTGEGNVLIYDILDKPSAAASRLSTRLSSSNGSLSSSPTPHGDQHLKKIASMDKIEEKIHELYFQRLQEQKPVFSIEGIENVEVNEEKKRSLPIDSKKIESPGDEKSSTSVETLKNISGENTEGDNTPRVMSPTAIMTSSMMSSISNAESFESDCTPRVMSPATVLPNKSAKNGQEALENNKNFSIHDSAKNQHDSHGNQEQKLTNESVSKQNNISSDSVSITDDIIKMDSPPPTSTTEEVTDPQNATEEAKTQETDAFHSLKKSLRKKDSVNNNTEIWVAKSLEYIENNLASDIPVNSCEPQFESQQLLAAKIELQQSQEMEENKTKLEISMSQTDNGVSQMENAMSQENNESQIDTAKTHNKSESGIDSEYSDRKTSTSTTGTEVFDDLKPDNDTTTKTSDDAKIEPNDYDTKVKLKAKAMSKQNTVPSVKIIPEPLPTDGSITQDSGFEQTLSPISETHEAVFEDIEPSPVDHQQNFVHTSQPSLDVTQEYRQKLSPISEAVEMFPFGEKEKCESGSAQCSNNKSPRSLSPHRDSSPCLSSTSQPVDITITDTSSHSITMANHMHSKPPTLDDKLTNESIQKCSSAENIQSNVSWSSYDELTLSTSPYDSSTHELDRDLNMALNLEGRGRIQSAASVGSLMSPSMGGTDALYVYEMQLQAKVKITDKPIRCLIETKCKEEPIIVSCAGCYGDDESILKWTREPNEKLWTNEPIVEISPDTHEPINASSRTRHRFSSSSSMKSNESIDSVKSITKLTNFFKSSTDNG
ncbi:unnamed protein product [Owenia fusiformis]|uniref:Uncharacterized protein n=1 Tax=Owenia fusiformis TaxID=6347 RepID=A0A8J1UHH1_OWEFU|nr:unnamed protein product [Owenia fusiformis]